MMKKILAALAAMLLLAGCGAQEQPPAAEPQPQQTQLQPVQEEQTPAVTELPMEPAPEETAEPEPEAEAADYTSSSLEGLAGDAVGYVLQVPSFGQSEIDRFYQELAVQMEDHAQGTVHDNCLERHCMANVYGKVTTAVREDDVLTVGYEYRVEYSDAEEPEVSQRTDSFRLDTGEKLS